MDSPTVYYRSAAGDKASDYEDIWGPEQNGHTNCSSFKPIPMIERNNKFNSPDVIPHHGKKVVISSFYSEVYAIDYQ